MSKIICYESRFICELCGITDITTYVWTDREKNPVCEPCNEQMTEVPKDYGTSTFFIATHKKGRSEKERLERKSKNFRKEILPTLQGADRRYFEKKFGNPL